MIVNMDHGGQINQAGPRVQSDLSKGSSGSAPKTSKELPPVERMIDMFLLFLNGHATLGDFISNPIFHGAKKGAMRNWNDSYLMFLSDMTVIHIMKHRNPFMCSTGV